MHNKQVLIVLGKPKHTYIQRNIVYFPIYLVANQSVKSQIGIVEIPKNRVLELTDDDGDLDVANLPTPLYYGFANENYLDRNGSDSEIFLNSREKSIESIKEKEKEEEEEEEEEAVDDDDDDDVLTVKVKPSNMSK